MRLETPVPIPGRDLRVFLADDWFLWAEDSDGRVWMFNTELWPEWLETVDGVPDHGGYEPPVLAMIQFAHSHSPRRVRQDGPHGDRHHMTREEFDACEFGDEQRRAA